MLNKKFESEKLRVKSIKMFLACLCSVLLVLSSIAIFAVSANAATITWDGGGGDNLASTAANWSGNTTPQSRDAVIFDSTSKNCTWDLSVNLASLTVNSGYTGKITKTSGTTLVVADSVIWTGGGADNLASNPDNWLGRLVPRDGDKVVFKDSAKSVTWDINATPASLTIGPDYTATVTLNTALSITSNLALLSGTLNLNNRNLSVDGYLYINAGTSLYATSSTITVKGYWANYGNFFYGTSTVILAGTKQTIYGNTTFCNLIKTSTTTDTLYFQAGSSQTIICSLTLQGASNNLLSLRSTTPGSYWYIDPQGARNVSFVDMRDMYNINFVNTVVTNSVDSGNNTGVSFGGSECVCNFPLPWRERVRGDFIPLYQEGLGVCASLWQRGGRGDFEIISSTQFEVDNRGTTC